MTMKIISCVLEDDELYGKNSGELIRQEILKCVGCLTCGHLLEKVRVDQSLEVGEGVSWGNSREVSSEGQQGSLCHPLERAGLMVEYEVPELRGGGLGADFPGLCRPSEGF